MGEDLDRVVDSADDIGVTADGSDTAEDGGSLILSEEKVVSSCGELASETWFTLLWLFSLDASWIAFCNCADCTGSSVE